MHSHAGRATRNVAREPAPRPRARAVGGRRSPGSSPTSSGCRSAGWCACSRCPSPSGRGRRCSSTCPAAASRPTCPSGRRRRRRRLRRRAAHVRVVPRRQLAGPHRGQRAPAVRRRRAPISTRSSGPSTSCRRRGPTGSAVAGQRARRGAGPRSCSTRVGAHAPAVVPRRRRPATAPSATCGTIVALLDGDRDLVTALAHDVDAAPGEWRFRVYRRGTPAALAELLPLLDHLGLQALDERPFDVPVRRRAGPPVRHRRAGAGRRRARRPRAGPSCSGRSPRLVARRRRERRLQPAGAARRADGARGGRRSGPTASTSARSASRSASRTSSRRCAAHPALVADLVALFHARFDPRRRRRPRGAREAACRARVDRRRSTPSRASTTTASAGRSCTLIDATVRTNSLPRTGPADRVQARPGDDPRPAAAAPDARDLGVLAPGRGRAPARRRASPAAACAGATAGRTSAPRCSG